MLTLAQLTNQAKTAKVSGDYSTALRLYHYAQRQFPLSVSAEHNLAALLGDMKEFEASLNHARAAIRKGSNASQTWLVCARALTGLQRYDEALKAYEKALELNPLDYNSHREKAQLIWMRTGELAAALQDIDQILKRQMVAPLVVLKAQMFGATGDFESACLVLKESTRYLPASQEIVLLFIYMCLRVNQFGEALENVNKLLESEPANFQANIAASYTHAALGNGVKALACAENALKVSASAQEAIACKAIGLRLAYLENGQAEYLDEYNQLYNYDELVTNTQLDTPKGWRSLQSFFSDLATELKKLHHFRSPPFGQSVRGGGQLPNLFSFGNPVLNSLKEALEGPIKRHLMSLGHGEDPVRCRNTMEWKVDGIWSVLLPPGGHHENHIHPDGWLSSACYIDLPAEVGNSQTKDGWLRLGEPLFPTTPTLAGEYWVRPQVGNIVMFPSYMWHGTNLFAGSEPRLSVALDILPR